MPNSSAVAQYLPFLRRYARALTGSQASGDAYVAATLEALIADRLSPATVQEMIAPESMSNQPISRPVHRQARRYSAAETVAPTAAQRMSKSNRAVVAGVGRPVISITLRRLGTVDS